MKGFSFSPTEINKQPRIYTDGRENPMPLCILEITAFLQKKSAGDFVRLKPGFCGLREGGRCLMGASQQPSGNATMSGVKGCVCIRLHVRRVCECVSDVYANVFSFAYAETCFLPYVCAYDYSTVCPPAHVCVCVCAN